MKICFFHSAIKFQFIPGVMMMENSKRERDAVDDDGEDDNVQELARQVGGGVTARFSTNLLLDTTINVSPDPVDDDYYVNRSNFEIAHQLRRADVLNAIFQMKLSRQPQVIKMMYNPKDPAGPMMLWFEEPSEVVSNIENEELRKIISDILTVQGTDCSQLLLICNFSWKAYIFRLEDAAPPPTDEQVFDALTKFNLAAAAPAAAAATC